MKFQSGILVILTAGVCLSSSCSSGSGEDPYAGVIWPVLLITAVPVAAVTQSYKHIADDGKPHALQQPPEVDIFTPVYMEKIRLIGNRYPVVDAQTLFLNGIVGLLPNPKEVNSFPGIPSGIRQLDKFESNKQILEASQDFKLIQQLLSRDPSDIEPERNEFYKHLKIRTEFDKTAESYRITFNREMYRLVYGVDPVGNGT